jgi:hypothetical protein
VAAITFTLTAETSAVMDVVGLLARVHETLFSRHGERFRALRRDIEALADMAWVDGVKWHDLGEGIHACAAPEMLTDLVVRARDLGVI